MTRGDGTMHGIDEATKPRRPLIQRGWMVAVLLLAVTLVTQLWMTSLEFQLDDYEQIHDAAYLDGPAVLLGQDSPGQTARRARPSFVKYFRPVLHASLALDVALFGARPYALHLSSLLHHVLASWLLFVALSRILLPHHRRLSLMAALLFAVHPGKWGAVSWVAARGDVLMTIFFLLALVMLARWRAGGGVWRLLAAFVATAAAMLSKEGGVVCPVLLAMIDFFVLRRQWTWVSAPRALAVAVPMLSLAPAYLFARQKMFGEYANYYAGHTRVFTWDIVRRMVADVGPSFSKLASGYFHHDAGSWLTWLQGAFSTLALIAVAVWASRRPLRRLPPLALLAALYLAAAAPTLRFLREGSGFDASRLFYLPAVFMAVALALPLQGLFVRLRALRLFTMIYAVALGLTLVVSGFHHVRAQLAAAELIARVRQDLTAIGSSSPRPGVAYALLDVPTDVDHAPAYGTFLGYAFRPPFVDGDGVAAEAVINLELVLRSKKLYAVKPPLQLLRWVDGGGTGRDRGRLVPETKILPAPKGYRPRLRFGEGETSVTIEGGLAPRDVEVLLLHFAAAAEEAVSVDLHLTDEHGDTAKLTLDIDPAFGSTKSFYIPVHALTAWLFRGLIQEIAYGCRNGPPLRLETIETDAALPAITIVAPEDDSEHPVTGPEPKLVFRDPNAFPWLRIRLFIHPTTMTWTFPRTRFEKQGENLTISLSQPGFLPGEIPIYWEELRSGRAGNLLSEQGVARRELDWMVEGLAGQGSPDAYAQGASRIARMWITR